MRRSATVAISWSNHWENCKSRLSAIARCCYLGRSTWKERALKHQETISELQSSNSKLSSEIAAKESLIDTLTKQLEQLKVESKSSKVEADVQLPCIPIGGVPAGLQFDAKMIELSLNLARRVGMRPAVASMEIMFRWLELNEQRIPTYQAIRTWMLRMGLARLNKRRKRKDATWLVDHSIQIGKEKVLVIVCVRPSSANKVGPLQLEDIEILALEPSIAWSKEAIEEVYKNTAKRFGMPRAIVCDGAADLREAVKCLENDEEKPIVLRDVKHFFANRMKEIFLNDPVYAGFTKRLKQTCSSVQQTELAHFVPRAIKKKSRFMNMDGILEWAEMALWHLDHPQSKARSGISQSRFQEKLGWLTQYREKIDQWLECLKIVKAGTAMIAKRGISKGTSRRFGRVVEPIATSTVSNDLKDKTIEFLKSQESLLRKGERQVMSTEILESSFAVFKNLERQHSKEGFTSLVLAFGTLLQKASTPEVFSAFKSVKNKEVAAWTKKHMNYQMNAKRQTAFRELRANKKKHATQSLALV